MQAQRGTRDYEIRVSNQLGMLIQDPIKIHCKRSDAEVKARTIALEQSLRGENVCVSLAEIPPRVFVPLN